MTKDAMLEKLKNEVISSNVCLNLKQQANNLVFGSGNCDSPIIFIGEAPGKNEDLKGMPFVGAAGKVLDELLKSSRIRRSDIYITNIVKYRPPQNRDPLKSEKEAFLPYLLRQIAIINPKVIVTLGRHSLNSLMPELKISLVHGIPQKLCLASKELKSKFQDIVLVPFYHPAAAIYNPKMKPILMDDFKILNQFIT